MKTETILQSVSSKQKKYFDIHIDRYRFILKQIEKLNLPKNSKILDIGCFPAHLSDSLSSLGYDVYGVSSFHENVTSSKIFSINIENQNLPFKKDFFDLVLFSEVLEHLTEYPERLFLEVSRVLKKSGYFLITTPNAARSQNILLLLLNKNTYPPLDQFKTTHFQDGTIYHRHNREYVISELSNIYPKKTLILKERSTFVSFTPFRTKNRSDKLSLKLVKIANYFLMMMFPSKKDTLYLLYQKQ